VVAVVVQVVVMLQIVLWAGLNLAFEGHPVVPAQVLLAAWVLMLPV